MDTESTERSTIIAPTSNGIRDLIESYVSTDTTWVKQEKRLTLKLIEKVL